MFHFSDGACHLRHTFISTKRDADDKQTKPGRTLDLQDIVMVTCPHQCALTGVTLFDVKQDPNCYRSRIEGPDCQEEKESERLNYAGSLLQQLSILAAEQRIKGR